MAARCYSQRKAGGWVVDRPFEIIEAQRLARRAVELGPDDAVALSTAGIALAFEGDSHVEWFEGNFQDYEEDKKRRLGEDSVMPKRIKYKQFSR